MAKSDLILLHHGYGTGIRNRWLRGNRDPQLLRFFRDNGIDDIDHMSGVIIDALWNNLNSNLDPAERASLEAKRALVVAKRASYEKLESECEAQLVKARDEFDRNYKTYGLPSKNPGGREPFYELVVEKTGRVRDIVFFDGASFELKEHLRKTIQQFKFSAFANDEQVTIYIVDFPRCLAKERDKLY